MYGKRILTSALIIVAAIFLTFGLIWYFSRLPGKQETPSTKEQEKETIIRQQLNELAQLRAKTFSLAKEAINNQLKELQNLFKKQKPLHQDQIKKQLEEMDKLMAQ